MFPDGALNPNLFAVQISFANLFSQVPKTVLVWISNCNPTENKIRLSCAMGYHALWSSETVGFIHDMMRAPVGFSDDIIAEAMQSFTLAPKKGL